MNDMSMIRKAANTSILLFILCFAALIPGCYKPDTPDYEYCEFILVMDKVDSRTTAGNETVWDAYFTIDAIEPADYQPEWTKIEIQVFRGGEWGGHIGIKEVKKFNFTPGDEPEVWYEDLTGQPAIAEVLDSFIITGMSESFEGGRFIVYYDESKACEFGLPVDLT
ncbi:MAG: hypothetical protein ACMUHU_00515 [Thermoplasmatota archaeon]